VVEIVGTLVAVFVLSWGLTGAVRRYALQRDLLDHPNARSSHEVPTPRGGGLAIVAAFSIGLFVLVTRDWTDAGLVWVLLPPALMVAAVGFLDDHGHVRRTYRLLIHLVAAGWCAWWLLPDWPPWALVLVTPGLAWFVNLYNFMDGIDGIAASEAIFLAGATAALGLLSGMLALAIVGSVLAAASAGFLVWNRPPARIFLGDVGSGFLGLTIGAVLLGAAADTGNPWPWLLLPSIFVVDASVTLVKRVLRGERFYEAHRSHAYQIAARRWGHSKVTGLVLIVDILVLAPLALWATLRPDFGATLNLLVYPTLCVAALAISTRWASD
jgi:Fuc2NAc and GlcNAc transferase